MRLTKSAIDRIRYEKTDGKQDIRWDDSLSGFGIRIYPSGKKSFVVFYRYEGRQHLMTIGQYGPLTADMARKKARKHLANTDEKNPLHERQRKRRGKTVADLCEDYIDRHARPHKKTWKKDKQRLERHVVPVWGSQKVKAIKRADVAALHHKIGKKAPYEANRLLALIRKMFNLAIDWGYLDDQAVNPATRITLFKEHKRERWVTPEELPRIAKAIDQEENVYARYALWGYLLTGLRRNEMLTIKRADIDWVRNEITIPDTKSGRPHYLPLSSEAQTLFRKIPELAGNPYLFPGVKDGQPLVNLDKPWARIKKAAKVEDIRIHDLRRTVGSWLAQSGNSLHLIGRVLNQATASSTQVYARFAQDNVREALEAHGKKIMNVARGKKADVVRVGKGNG